MPPVVIVHVEPAPHTTAGSFPSIVPVHPAAEQVVNVTEPVDVHAPPPSHAASWPAGGHTTFKPVAPWPTQYAGRESVRASAGESTAASSTAPSPPALSLRRAPSNV